MSTRLQVVLEQSELAEIRAAADAEGTTVSEWVRQTLRQARRASATTGVEDKLDAVRAAMRHEFPAPEIDQMLAEIERGYLT